MVNRTGQQSGIPQLSRQTGVTGGVPQVRYGTTSPAPRNAGANFEAMANNFYRMSQRIENQLDIIARDDGARSGMMDGAESDVDLRRDSTIRGRAYDQAATRAMSARHDTQARITADQIYQEHKDNPTLLGQKLQEYSSGVQQSTLPDEVKTEFSLSFDRLSASYISDAQRRQEALTLDADRAEALSNLETRQKSIARLARLSENDAEAATAMAAEIDDLKKFLLSHGPKGGFEFDGVTYAPDAGRSGAFSLEQIQSRIINAAGSAMENRVLGKFLQAGILAEKERILKAFEADFISGKSEFDLAQYESLSGKMRAQLNRMEAGSRGEVAHLGKEIKSVQDMIEDGYNPGEGLLESLEVRASLAGDPDAVARVREARALFTFQDNARQLRPDQLQSWINESQAQIADGATPDQVERIQMAEKLLSNMSTELNRDPLSWANRVGIIEAQPLQFGQPETLKKRAQDATTVAEYYGTRPQMLTDEEVLQFKSGWDAADPDSRAQMVAMIQSAFGEDSVYAFEDISKASDSLANIGGLLAQSRNHAGTVRDYTIGEAALQSGSALIPSGADIQSAQSEILGNAYGTAGRTRSAVVETAEKLYAAKALRKGITAEDFDSELYERSLQEAAGAWYDRDNRQYGGIINQRGGHYMVLPPNMSEDQFEDVLDSIDETGSVLASVGNGAPVHDNGAIATPREIAKSYLISNGPGRYLVSTTDPTNGPPTFLRGSNDLGLYEIDINQYLEARR